MISPIELFPCGYLLSTRVGDRPLYLRLLAGERVLMLDSGCASDPEVCIRPALTTGHAATFEELERREIGSTWS